MSDTISPAAPAASPPPPPDDRTRLAVIAVAIGAVVLLGLAALAVSLQGDDGPDPDEGWHGTLQGPTPRPEFTLTDTEGRPFDFAAETQGRLTLLFFGYTHCPDVCPGHLSILSGALAMPGMPQPQVVFVTTDPARDTPERLREWLGNFDEDFIGLTGTVEEVAAAEQAAFLPPSGPLDDDGDFAADQPDAADDYEVGHAAQILAYTPDDQSHLAYPFGTRQQDWADDLPRMLEAFPAGSGDASGDASGAGAGSAEGSGS